MAIAADAELPDGGILAPVKTERLRKNREFFVYKKEKRRRIPNTVCSTCGEGIYRSRALQKGMPNGYCATCYPAARARAASRQADKNYRAYIERWKRGEETGMRGKTGISAHIRRYLFAKYKSRCSKCEWAEVNRSTGKVPLTVNHIDGIHTNCGEENLELICPNCHSLTSNYCSLNRGKGRPRG